MIKLSLPHNPDHEIYRITARCRYPRLRLQFRPNYAGRTSPRQSSRGCSSNTPISAGGAHTPYYDRC